MFELNHYNGEGMIIGSYDKVFNPAGLYDISTPSAKGYNVYFKTDTVEAFFEWVCEMDKMYGKPGWQVGPAGTMKAVWEPPEPIYLPHHWAQGPGDIEILNKSATRGLFRYLIENPTAIAGVSADELDNRIHYTLNEAPNGWHKTGVHFLRTRDLVKANIVLRYFDNAAPNNPDWRAGSYYRDEVINKAVARITPDRAYYDDPLSFVYLNGMELVGHGAFWMDDMYTRPHLPYPYGSMGTWEVAKQTGGYPSALEIAAGKAFMRGEAVNVHRHSPIEW